MSPVEIHIYDNRSSEMYLESNINFVLHYKKDFVHVELIDIYDLMQA